MTGSSGPRRSGFGAGASLALARLGAGGHADRLLNRPHVHSQPAGQSARVLSAQRSILDVGDDAGGGAQALHSPLGAAKIHLGQDGTNREFKQRGARVHQVNDRLVSRRQPKLARVLAARGDSHERLRRKVLVLPVRAQRSLAPGAVAVKGEDHLRPVRATARQEHPRRRVGVVAQEAANDPNVLGSERRPTRGHGVRHARNVGRHDVGVPLDDHHPVVGGDRLLGQVEAVQELRLLVDGGLRGVEVLRGVLLRLVQPSRPEADGRARDVADRPHQAPAEAIVDAPGALRGQARDLDFLVREALGTQVAGQGIPGGRGVANPKVRAHRLAESPVREELASRVRLGAGQLSLIELLGHAVGVQQALALARLLGAHPRPALLVVEGDAGFGREHLHGLREGKVVDLLHEGNDVPALPAPEAVEHAQVGTHVEGGGPLVVEGAQALEGADSRGFERYVFADDLVDLERVTYRFNVVLANQTRHVLQSTEARNRARRNPKAGRRASRTSGRARTRLTRR